jgi:hypothetical protein
MATLLKLAANRVTEPRPERGGRRGDFAPCEPEASLLRGAARSRMSFDKYSLLLENNNQEQLIFKHAISTVVATKVRVAAPPPAQAAPAQAPGLHTPAPSPVEVTES